MNSKIVLSCLLVAFALSACQGASLDTALYARYVCRSRADGFKTIVPGSCSQYYQCQSGRAVVNTCPRFFDAQSKACVYQNPGCVETIKSLPSCQGPCCGIADGNYAVDTTNQAIYYLCKNNCVAETNTCDSGLMFDLVALQCASPSTCTDCSTPKPPCQGTVTTTPCATTTSPCQVVVTTKAPCKPEITTGTTTCTTTTCTTTTCTTTTCTTAPVTQAPCEPEITTGTTTCTTTTCTTTTCTTAPVTQAPCEPEITTGTTTCTTTTCTTTTCTTTTCTTAPVTQAPCEPEITTGTTTCTTTTCTTTTCTTTTCTTTTCTTTTCTTTTCTTTTCTTTTCTTAPVTQAPCKPEITTGTTTCTTTTCTTTTCTTTVKAPCQPKTTTCTTTKAPCTTTKAPCNNQPASNGKFNGNGNALKDATHYILPSQVSNDEMNDYLTYGCINKPEGFLLPSLSKCNQYYVCRRQIALPLSCGAKYFNVQKGICDLPKNTGCIQVAAASNLRKYFKKPLY